jgi:SAM-dependent methyltransferase
MTGDIHSIQPTRKGATKLNEQEMLTQILKIFHHSLPRLGPGDDQSTRRALEMIPGDIRRADRHILDLGCGNGAQTLCLARHLAGRITAVDNHPPFLEALTARARAAGYADRIHPLLADMAAITPEQGPFDLIWCEGAIYNMGFEKGLRHCRRLLSKGFLALSDLSWLGDERPQACLDLFSRQNVPVLGINDYLGIIENVGFKTLGHFELPADSWWTDYYIPLAKRLGELRESCPDDFQLLEMIGFVEEEIEVFRRYPQAYGYVFYIMQM